MLAVSFPHFYFSTLSLIIPGFGIFATYKYGPVGGKTTACRIARGEATHLHVPRLQYALNVPNTVALEKHKNKLLPLTEQNYIRIDQAKITFAEFPDIRKLLSDLTSGAKKIHLNNVELDYIIQRIAEFL